MRIFNNGTPLSEDITINSDHGKSLGLQLIGMLVKQIDGEIEINREGGTEFKIRFEDTKKFKN